MDRRADPSGRLLGGEAAGPTNAFGPAAVFATGVHNRSMPQLLMIDDDARLAAMVRDYLATSGYMVDVTGSAAAGLDQLAREPGRYELVLLDLMLPDGDGLDL